MDTVFAIQARTVQKEGFIESLRPDEATSEIRLAVVWRLTDELQRISADIQVVLGGSVAKGTDMPGSSSDIDIVARFPHSSYSSRQAAIDKIKLRFQALPEITTLSQRSVYLPSTGLVDARQQSSADAQTFCNGDYLHGIFVHRLGQGVAFDLLVTTDRVATPISSPHDFCISLLVVHANWIASLPDWVKDSIRILKWWVTSTFSIECPERPRPKSFLLELLTCYALDTSSSAVELFKSTLWCIVQQSRAFCPVLVDPYNASNNVAKSLSTAGWHALGSSAEKMLQFLNGGNDFQNIDSITPKMSTAVTVGALDGRSLVDHTLEEVSRGGFLSLLSLHDALATFSI
eukprot:TRINITY_DN24369_c0_g1_i1.p1 TRINITY_DN24369_c0_g1~~TRINITY_DN24369_c0_g1_i1.p1  ORF type:complete len:346 (+),score=25.11 TRINITY_DN24369_c0_g1_i1:67-1104(+)